MPALQRRGPRALVPRVVVRGGLPPEDGIKPEPRDVNRARHRVAKHQSESPMCIGTQKGIPHWGGGGESRYGAVKCARNGQRAMSKLPLPYSRGPPGLPDVLLVMDDMDMVPKERSPSQGRRGTLFAAAGRGAGENCIAVSGCQRGKRGRRPVSKVWLAHRDRHPRTQGQPKLKAAPIFEAAGEAHSAHKADHSEVGRKVPAGQRGRVVMHPPDVFLWHAATRRAENHMQVCGQRVRCPPHSSTNPMRRRMASSLLISRRCPCVHADAALPCHNGLADVHFTG